MSAEQLSHFRQDKDEVFKAHPHSPLTSAQRAEFTGLQYYPYNPDLDMTLNIHPFDEKQDVQIQTTTGKIRWYRRFGEIKFPVDDEEVRLTLYQTPHGFFLPFVDAGAGDETYPSGRYLDPEPIDEHTVHVDLNQAYNPYCAYNPAYSCPLTPAENRLKVSIQAGEKIPEGDWVSKY